MPGASKCALSRISALVVAAAIVHCAAVCTALPCEPSAPTASSTHEGHCGSDTETPVSSAGETASCDAGAADQLIPKKLDLGHGGASWTGAIVGELLVQPSVSASPLPTLSPARTATQNAIRTTVLTL